MNECSFDFDVVINRFASAWANDGPQEIEDYLHGVPDRWRRHCLIELIKIDLARRWQHEFQQLTEEVSPVPTRPLLDDYVRVHNELGALWELPLELIIEEYRVRHQHGDRLTIAEYIERFRIDREVWLATVRQIEPRTFEHETLDSPHKSSVTGDILMRTRCPHCHHPIDIVDDAELKEVICDSCGSSISLLGNQTTATLKGEMRRTLGHFELIERLGIGNFGAVWKAFDTKLDRTVAIKIPRKGELNADESTSFFREARAAGQLRHPNIVRVHEVGRQQDTVFIVTDYIEGANLREWLTANRLTPREAAGLCMKLAEAVHHAHEAGVVHRDLKPSNVMLDMESEPHILDFGLAKRDAGEITMTMDGQILGTPAYMSPEQAKGKGHEADRRSDVYSLGVMLFELLTGELPFRGESRMLIVQILKDDPPSPRSLDARIPRDLETICLKCLEKQSDKRYESAQDLADDLSRYLRNDPIRARPIRSPERLWRWCKRKPAVAASWATAALLLLTIGIGGALLAFQQRRIATQQMHSLFISERNSATISTQKRRIEILLYASYLSQALAAWEKGETSDAIKALNSTNPNLRQWEFMYLSTLFFPDNRLFHGHDSPVLEVSFSGDGARIASVSRDGTITVWDSAAGTKKSTASTASRPLSCAASSVTGSWIACSDGDSISLFPAPDFSNPLLWKKDELIDADITSLAFSNDESFLLSKRANGDVTIRKIPEGNPVHRFKVDASTTESAALSRDGRLVAVARKRVPQNKSEVLLYTASGELILAVDAGDGNVSSIAFSPIGKVLAIACDDGTIRLRDALTGLRLLDLASHRDAALDVDFNQDGSRLISGGKDAATIVWDIATGRQLLRLKEHAAPVGCVAFDFSGKQIAGGDNSGTVIASVADKSHRSQVIDVFDGPVNCLEYSSNSQTLISGSGNQLGKVALWDTVQWKRLHEKECKSAIENVVFSQGNNLCATSFGNGEVRLWTFPELRMSQALRGTIGNVNCICGSRDGQYLATGNIDGTIQLWSLPDGHNLRTIRSDGAAVSCVAFSRNGNWLASGDDKGGLRMWESATGRAVDRFQETGHQGAIVSIEFNENDQILASGSADKMIKLWQVADGTLMKTLAGHDAGVRDVCFMPGGMRLASGSSDSTVRLWDLASGKEVLMLNEHPAEVTSVAVNPDGTQIVSGSRDGKVRVWGAHSTHESKVDRRDVD